MLLKRPPGRFRRLSPFALLGTLATRFPILVIALWLVVPAILTFATPDLSDAVRDHPVELVPASAPAMVAEARMTKAFNEQGGENLLLVVLTDDAGLSPTDETTYRALVQALHADTSNVATLEDFVATPSLREDITSDDHKAWILPVGLVGGLDTPQGGQSYRHVLEIVGHVTDSSTLHAGFAGPAATIADLTEVGIDDMHSIEIATAVLVLVILALVYRHPLTMTLPLITIGASLLSARGIVAGLSELGLGVSDETVIMMTAMVAGAGTDYAVFLISRYHEELRKGADSDTAVTTALGSVGKVIAASAATVGITFLCMTFAKLELLSTIGPPLAITVGVSMLAAFTLLPAILVLAGRRGWVNPRRELTTRFWQGFGERLVRRPATYFAASMAVLAVLATAGLFVRFDWDESRSLPESVPSNQGYAALNAHFPLSATIPQYVVISSPNDLRNPQALADLEQLAFRLSQVPGIDKVVGVTRPNGSPPPEATVGYQAGEVGTRLQDAADTITASKADLERLTRGADELAATLAQLRDDVNAAAADADDPRIGQALGLLSELSELAAVLPQTPEVQEIVADVNELRTEVNGARNQITALKAGVQKLATGSRELATGVHKLVDSTNQMGNDLREGAAFLAALHADSSGSAALSGFYLPTHALADTDLREAAQIFVSPDGHTVRYLFTTTLNPFSTEAMDQVSRVLDVAHDAQPNTALAGAQIDVAGFPSVNHDLREYYNHDLRFVMIVTLVVVFAILVLLLRAIVAPLHLIVSVVISYLSSLGVGVIAFQWIGGQELSWSVPGMAFIVLVAVGADYNMLLVDRVRTESSHSVTKGMVKTIGSTGGVITSAGLIFAASMFGLLFGSVTGMVQTGFIIGVGLLIDTFLVRTVTVPALTVLIGRANWWPTLWGRKAIPVPQEEVVELEPAVAA